MPDRIVELRREVASNPASRQFYQLGELLRRQGDAAEGAAVLRQGLEHHPRYVAAWVSLGRALVDLQDGDAAGTALERALELDPGNPVAWRLIGESRLLCGDRTGALVAMERALALVPGDEVLESAVTTLKREAERAVVAAQPDGQEPGAEEQIPLEEEAPDENAEAFTVPETEPAESADLAVAPADAADFEPAAESPTDQLAEGVTPFESESTVEFAEHEPGPAVEQEAEEGFEAGVEPEEAVAVAESFAPEPEPSVAPDDPFGSADPFGPLEPVPAESGWDVFGDGPPAPEAPALAGEPEEKDETADEPRADLEITVTVPPPAAAAILAQDGVEETEEAVPEDVAAAPDSAYHAVDEELPAGEMTVPAFPVAEAPEIDEEYPFPEPEETEPAMGEGHPEPQAVADIEPEPMPPGEADAALAPAEAEPGPVPEHEDVIDGGPPFGVEAAAKEHAVDVEQQQESVEVVPLEQGSEAAADDGHENAGAAVAAVQAALKEGDSFAEGLEESEAAPEQGPAAEPMHEPPPEPDEAAGQEEESVEVAPQEPVEEPAPVAPSGDPTPTVALARVLVQQQEFDRAVGVLNEVIVADPGNQEARDLRSLVLDMMEPLDSPLPPLSVRERKIAALQHWLASLTLGRDRTTP